MTLLTSFNLFIKEVIHIIHEINSCACCWCAGLCATCSHKVTVQAPPGNYIGKITQSTSLWGPRHQVYNENDVLIAEIKGPNLFMNKNDNFSILMKEQAVVNNNGVFYFQNSIPLTSIPNIKSNDKHHNYGIKCK